MKANGKVLPAIATQAPALTVLIARDNSGYMARCPELDLVTEMDHSEDAFKAIMEMIREYAKDYRKRLKAYASSPNRAHHRPYIDRINGCRNEWEIRELIGVRYGRLHI